MSEKDRIFEPCPKIRYANCPHCGKEAKVVKRSKDFRLYIIDCKECGRKKTLPVAEVEKLRTAWKEEHTRAILLPKLATLPQLRKNKTKPRIKREKEEEEKT